MNDFSKNPAISDLPNEVRQQALNLKYSKGKMEAIRFLTLEHHVRLLEAKDFVDGHDEFGRQIRPGRSLGLAVSLEKIFIGVGLLMFAIAFIIYYFQLDFIRHSVRTEGIVVDLISEGDTYAPVIAYEVKGQTYRTQMDVWTNPPAYEINEKVELWAKEADPGRIVVNSVTGRYLAIIILSAIGLVFALIGAGLLSFSRNSSFPRSIR
jgi:hypothetical protein